MRDEKWIEAIRRGDERAIDEVMRRYAKLLWTIADAVLRGVGSAQDAEECAADAFIRLWREPDKFDPVRGSLRTWLCMVTRSRALDRYRELTRRGELPLDEEQPARDLALDAALIAAEERKRLADALNALDAEDRDIFLRRYERGQKPKEIALALDVPVKQAENRLYRAKQKLRRAIREQNGGTQ